VAPGGFDLESRTALLEPGAELTSLVVFELGLFMAPDERRTGLQEGFGSEKRPREPTNIQVWAGFAASSADPTRRW